MANLPQDRSLSRAAGRAALALWLLLSAAACETATTATEAGAPFVLTTRGDPVRASSTPGIEVTLGAKRVLPTGASSPLD